ncbi:MAG: DeoR family transcriptional regulator, partial [Candidatus Cryptobacteroides sp.]
MKRNFGTEERRSLILNILHDKGKVMISDLVEEFGVSEVSIRKDLAILEEKQLLVRVKGGAIIIQQEGYDDPSIKSKQMIHAREKQILGKYAASLIEEDDTIIIDSG